MTVSATNLIVDTPSESMDHDHPSSPVPSVSLTTLNQCDITSRQPDYTVQPHCLSPNEHRVFNLFHLEHFGLIS